MDKRLSFMHNKTTFYLTLSRMSDLFFLIHGLMKIGSVIGVMVLVATWPERSSAAETVVRDGSLLFAGLVGASTENRCVRTATSAVDREFDDDAFAETGGAMKHLSLLGADEQTNNSPWPDPVSQTHEDRWMNSDSARFEPLFNIDGTMMLGDFDAHGNVYGVTDSHFDAWDSSASSMWDD